MVASTSLTEAEDVVAQAEARLAGALPNVDDMPIRFVSSTPGHVGCDAPNTRAAAATSWPRR